MRYLMNAIRTLLALSPAFNSMEPNIGRHYRYGAEGYRRNRRGKYWSHHGAQECARRRGEPNPELRTTHSNWGANPTMQRG